MRFILGVLLGVMLLPVKAQLIPSFGEERVGTTIGAALKIPLSARAAGLNDGVVALANDASVVVANPAGLFQTQSFEASFSAAQWLAGSRLIAASALYHVGSDDALAVNVARLGIDPLRVTTEVQPYGTGEWFIVEHIHARLSYAHRFTDQFSAGITVVGVSERLGKATLQGVLFDLGTLYYTGLARTRIALAISNFGTPLKPRGTVPLYPHDSSSTLRSFAPPTNFRFGVATEVFQDSLQRLTATVQFDHPADQAEQYVIGGEYARQLSVAMPFQIQVRAAYRINAPLTPWTAGVGLQIPLFTGWHIRIDYSLLPTRHFGMLHRLSLLLQQSPEE